ncbi:unnamed protein product [Vicia faba]|uniref:Protein kinase domain-containing protein n=1 Tax=Vicia faba TaxID=3906 RepID=A0AAV0ZCV8_VICFA|nr:unnamed protein product [Vicia faba]
MKISSFTFHYILTCFLIILTHAKSQSHYNLNGQEHETLMKIKQHFQNPPNLTHWTSSNTSHCSWPEINCTNGSITWLSLANYNISQTIPSFICDLKNLTHVDFNNNYIPGMFPTYLYNCSNMEYLDLSMNNFVGKIPDDIFRLSNLNYLNLSYTNFIGDIPSSVGRLKELRFLALQACYFNGTFPDEIGNLLNLETLDLSSNSFRPSELSMNWTKLSKLKVFYMYGCNLFGEMPEPIGNMVSLEDLDLSKNGLTGKIPSGLFMLKNLTRLLLSRNSLSGEMPDVVGALNLTIIDLAENHLTGKIPDDFGKLQKLTGLSLPVNNFSGEIPQSIGRLPSLIDLKVFMNNLSGTLPPDFGLYSKLRSFDVATNSFKGRLPENLCHHGELQNLTTYDNRLSGELPESLGSCSSLLEVKIYNNEFYGKIPNGLWKAENLVLFMVSNNKFSGELPQNLSSNISLFDISYNQFYGGIPIGVSDWTNVVEFIASKNNLNGSIPQELTALSKLERLLLDQNQLKGSLPFDIISWKSLVTLNLRQNQLNGEIPVSIGDIPSLSVLDLSENQFSGEIPSILPRLTDFNLSSNHLRGRVPSEFENSAYDRSFLNNSGLCADIPTLNLTLCNSNSNTQRKSKDSSLSPTLIVVLVVVSVLVASLISLMIIKLHRKSKQGFDNSSWKFTSFQRLNFTESDIVSSMTEHNIIGRGGYGTVYRVVIDGLGYVAVKKIWENKKLDNNLEKSFHTEVKILSSIRHRNIVKLLCCISNNDTMLLVYEYVENRSLDRWLHKKNNIKSSNMLSSSVHHGVLDWTKRMHIAIGVAQGLSYMHHECSPPVVHRDVKTSNILLDSQFNAKVTDFGLARMLIQPGELATMSAVIGSFGYMAPEYVQTTKVSEKVDVYSFGVILLELTTGKEANYGDEHSSLAEWSWQHIQAGSNIEELLDREATEPIHIDGMCKVFKLGVMCTSTLPSSRPSMREVLQVLLNFGEFFGYGERNVEHNNDVVPLLRNSKRESKLDIDNDSS